MGMSKLLCIIVLSLSCMKACVGFGLSSFLGPLYGCVLVFSHFFLVLHREFQMSFLNRFMIELISAAATFLVRCGVFDVVVQDSGTKPRMRFACFSGS